MQLSPRYGTDPLIVLPLVDISEAVIGQRRRLAGILATFTGEQWAHPTRCVEWSVQDVVAHLNEVNWFWTFSIRCGLACEPSTALAQFDPVAHPAASVAAGRHRSPESVLARFVDTTDELAAALGDVTDWSVLAEAPPGHLPISTVAHHALWDGWVHERDILLPQGLDPVRDDVEVTACLRYVAAVAPAFAINADPSRRGGYTVAGTGPSTGFEIVVDGHVVVHERAVEAPTLSGPSAELVDMLSIRSPMRVDVPDDRRWLFEGLAEVFDTV